MEKADKRKTLTDPEYGFLVFHSGDPVPRVIKMIGNPNWGQTPSDRRRIDRKPNPLFAHLAEEKIRARKRPSYAKSTIPGGGNYIGLMHTRPGMNRRNRSEYMPVLKARVYADAKAFAAECVNIYMQKRNPTLDKHGQAALETACEIMRNPLTPIKERIAAARLVMDFTVLKPLPPIPEIINITPPAPPVLTMIEEKPSPKPKPKRKPKPKKVKVEIIPPPPAPVLTALDLLASLHDEPDFRKDN